ncbi:uncharacterized protein LOC102630781 isoform X3 [Citrus sinensis]|uniref:uncharacterized protein LOC102630781 isoform X3 n=1 Tax=Citrus sinensis TaxID=2711 RepID=UPI0022775FFC|nr:uncharacterized protein LOC102630781 isoform X3 [Citrus sinensis]
MMMMGLKTRSFQELNSRNQEELSRLLELALLPLNHYPCLLFVQEVVLSADIRCSECQKRVADMMSKLNETESVLVNVSEKKVTLTSRYPVVVEVSKRQITAVRRNPLQKIAIIKRIFGSSSR